ncbi:MAG: hypothetical protein DRO01_01175 [Thermoproteota archaeon]|nr:MAG: hypothetical protein DRO01_01175 [Candidatus Korarchaeota archaeon]
MTRMLEKITKVIDRCDQHLKGLEQTREESIRLSRDLLRDARKAVSLAHRGLLQEAEEVVRSAISRYNAFLSGLSGDARQLAYVSLAQASQELAEAILVVKMLSGADPPLPEDLGVGCREYVLGLADAALELRRAALNLLNRGDLEGARRLVAVMEGLMDRLSMLVYPDSLLPVRHKVDTLRALIDRTKSDILYSAGGGIR